MNYKKIILAKAEEYSAENKIESDWSPIQKFFNNNDDVISKFALIGKSLTDNGVVVFNYKNNLFAKYLFLDTRGNPYKSLGKDRFEKISREEAIKQAL